MSIKKRIVSVLTAGGLLFSGIPITAFSPYTAVVSAAAEDVTIKENTTLEEDMTVSGDLIITDGTFKLNGHDLTVNGNIYQPGGILDVGTGSVKVNGNYELQAKGGYSGKGELQLYKEGSVFDVDGNVIINSNVSDSSYQNNGKMIIGGDLNVYSPSEGRGFMPSGSLVTEFKGEKQHNINFSSFKNYLNKVSVTDKGSLHLTGEISGFTLESDMTFADGSAIKGDKPLTLNGNTLTVDGNFTQNGDLTINVKDSVMQIKGNYYQPKGKLDVSTGSVKVGGNYELQAKGGYSGSGELQLYKEGSFLEVDGNVIINSNIESSGYQYDGKLIIGGDFKVYSPSGGKGYMPYGSHITEFKGTEKHEVYFVNSSNILNKVSSTGTGQLYLTGENSGFTLVSDLTFADGSVIKGDKPLTLNGNTLTVDGDFTQNGDLTINVKDSVMQVKGNYYQPKGILDVSTGSVKVGGNYELQAKGGYSGNGEFQLYKEGSFLEVDGNVIINSNVKSSGYQYNGKLIIGGDFKVYSPSGGKGYMPYGSHVTEFKGDNDHEVYFINSDNYLNKVSSTGTGQLYLTGENSGFTLVSDLTFADGSVIKGSKKLELNGNTLIIDGDFTQNGDLTINVNNSVMQVNGNYYQPKGILEISAGTVKVGGNYELQAKGGYSGSGEFQLYKENGHLDVDGNVIINSTTANSGYQYDGILSIGGDLKVYSPSDGRGYMPYGSHITEFKGGKDHEVYIINTKNYTGNIKLGIGDTLTFTGSLNGVEKSGGSITVSDTSFAEAADNTVKSISEGKTALEFSDGKNSVKKELIIDKTNETVITTVSSKPVATVTTTSTTTSSGTTDTTNETTESAASSETTVTTKETTASAASSETTAESTLSAGEATSEVTTATAKPEDDFLRGDISRNGKIDLYDAIMIAEYLVKKRNFDDEEMNIADFTGDGKVDLYDAIGIAKYMLTGKAPDISPSVTTIATTAVTTVVSATTVSTSANTTASGSVGTSSAVKDGNSAAFKSEMREGLVVSADENAFEYDGQLKVSEVDSDTVSELSKECYESDLAMLDCWEVNAGLEPDDFLPGSYHCEYDLSKLNIPEDMYDQIKVIRYDADGYTEFYNCKLNGSTISWDSSQNSFIIMAAAVVTVAGAMAVNDYGDTMLKFTNIESEHFIYYFNDFESNRTKMYEIEKEAWDKALKVTKEEFKVPDDKPYDKLENYNINCQALGLKTSYLASNEEYRKLKKDEYVPPEDIKKISEYFEDAYKYLTEEVKAKAPNRKITIVCMAYKDMSGKNDSWGYNVNPTNYGLFTIRKPHIQIRRPQTIKDISDPSTSNNTRITAAHELFHLFTTVHYPTNTLERLEFAEITAQWLENEYTEYCKGKGLLVLDGTGEYVGCSDNKNHFYLFADGIFTVPDDSNTTQNKGYTLSGFTSFLSEKKYAKYYNAWDLSADYRYSGTPDLKTLFCQKFSVDDTKLEQYLCEYAKENIDNISEASLTKDENRNNIVVYNPLKQENKAFKRTVSRSPFSVKGIYISSKKDVPWSYLMVVDPSIREKNPDFKIILPEGGVETKAGYAAAHSTGKNFEGAIEYQGFKGISEDFDYNLYFIYPPEKPELEYESGSDNISVTLSYTTKSPSREDRATDGYMINFYVDGDKNPVYSEQVSFENADKKISVPLEKLKLSKGSTAKIRADVQEYVAAEGSFKEFRGPLSEKSGSKNAGTQEEPKEEEYVWVLTDVTVDAGENSSELKHVYSMEHTYTENVDGKITEKTALVSANICCKKAPPQIIKTGEAVTLDLSIEDLTISPSENFPENINANFRASADFYVRWKLDYEPDDPFSVEQIYMGDTNFYSEDSSGEKQTKVFWDYSGEKYLSGTFVCDKFNTAGNYRYINFTSDAGTTTWKYEKRIAKEYEWKLVDTVNEPAENYTDDQNTYIYKISEETDGSVKKSVHVFSAKNSTDELEDETAVFTAKCPVPPQTLKTLDAIKLEMTMELESNAKVIPWDDTSKVYIQKISDDAVPSYFKASDGGKNYCFRKTVNLDGSTPEQISSATVTSTVPAAYEENDKWEIVFESRSGKTRWIYECTSVTDNQN